MRLLSSFFNAGGADLSGIEGAGWVADDNLHLIKAGVDLASVAPAAIKGTGWVANDNLHLIKAGVDANGVAIVTLNTKLRAAIDPPLGIAVKTAGSAANHLPSLAADGGYIILPVATSGADVFKMYNASNVLVWTSPIPSAITALADAWAPYVWYDTVESMIYGILIDVGASPYTCYLVKINNTTGAATLIGSGFSADIGNSGWKGSFFRRAAHGSGNFTLRTAGGMLYTISSTLGTLLSGPVQKTLGSVVVPQGEQSYMTQAGTIIISYLTVAYSGSTAVMKIYRGGAWAALYEVESVTRMLGDGEGQFIDWGPWVVMTYFVAGSTAVTGSKPGYTRYYDKVDFDRWLVDLADFVNLPT